MKYEQFEYYLEDMEWKFGKDNIWELTSKEGHRRYVVDFNGQSKIVTATELRRCSIEWERIEGTWSCGEVDGHIFDIMMPSSNFNTVMKLTTACECNDIYIDSALKATWKPAYDELYKVYEKKLIDNIRDSEIALLIKEIKKSPDLFSSEEFSPKINPDSYKQVLVPNVARDFAKDGIYLLEYNTEKGLRYNLYRPSTREVMYCWLDNENIKRWFWHDGSFKTEDRVTINRWYEEVTGGDIADLDWIKVSDEEAVKYNPYKEAGKVVRFEVIKREHTLMKKQKKCLSRKSTNMTHLTSSMSLIYLTLTSLKSL